MTLVSALAHLEAMATQTAQPLSAYRHRHLSDRPLVLIPLMMAGEAGAPLAVIAGTSKFGGGQILIVPQPRNRDQRFAFAAELGRIVMDYVDSFRAHRIDMPAGRDGEPASRYADAPQILVPNRGGITAIKLLGRMTRFRSPDGPFAVDPAVPLLGGWFTYLAERAEYAGCSALTAMTDVLSELWATGQSAMEDQNLASLIGWIAPPPGMTGLQAALEGEDPEIWPPAGPATSPEFDNKILAPAVTAFDQARATGDAAAQNEAADALRAAITTQLQPTWNKMWQGVGLARAVPEAPRADVRWQRECVAFTNHSDRMADGGRPQPKRDYPISAAARLSRLEQAQTDFERERAMDDPYAMADLRCTGEAFGGSVETVDPYRTVISEKNRKTLRPRFTVRTPDLMRIPAGAKLISPDFPKGHQALLVETRVDGGQSVVTVEVVAGMGTVNKPAADAVPDIGRQVAFLPYSGYQPAPAFPDKEHTPWTHGGPPGTPETVAEDAAEQWGSQ
jgi:hypothetical protein